MSVFRRAAERRGTPASMLAVGIGNPGEKYVGTRHNVGFEVIETLLRRHGGSLATARRERAKATTVDISGEQVAIACPLTFMNLSGEAVGPLVRRFGIVDPARVVIVHDELDLEPGRLKLKLGGSSAGHNGVESVASHLGTDDFLRVRIGVGKPPHPKAGKDWVLKKISKADREVLDQAIERAADAVEFLATSTVDAAMNEFNRA